MDTMELIRFWSRQLSEHALFMQLGLDPADLKKTADDLHSQYEKFRGTIPADVASPDQVTELTAKSVELATSLRGFETEVYDRLSGGEWLGWLFPTFVDHIRREGDYFITSASGGGPTGMPLVANKLCTWLGFMAEHAIFAAHLLDPAEVTLIAQGKALSERFQELGDSCRSMEPQLLGLSKRCGDQLDLYFTQNGIGTGSVSSVIHPVLALHVVREGRMFLRTLQALDGDKCGELIEIPE